MAVEVILTIASVGSWIAGSGTLSTRTSRLPCHVSAFIKAHLVLSGPAGDPACSCPTRLPRGQTGSLRPSSSPATGCGSRLKPQGHAERWHVRRGRLAWPSWRSPKSECTRSSTGNCGRPGKPGKAQAACCGDLPVGRGLARLRRVRMLCHRRHPIESRTRWTLLGHAGPDLIVIEIPAVGRRTLLACGSRAAQGSPTTR